jgi:hypothetical protein
MAVAFSLGAAVMIAACSGGGKKSPTVDAPTRVPVVIPGTDVVVLPLNAALKSDAVELARLTGYTSVACTTNSSSPAAQAPPCREGEDNGTKVDVFARLACDGSWVRSELVPGEYGVAMAGGPKLYGVYAPKRVAGAFGSDLGIEQVVVMTNGKRLDGSTNGFALHTKNGRVVMLQTVCDSLERLVSPDVVDSFIVDPTKAAGASGQ